VCHWSSRLACVLRQVQEGRSPWGPWCRGAGDSKLHTKLHSKLHTTLPASTSRQHNAAALHTLRRPLHTLHSPPKLAQARAQNAAHAIISGNTRARGRTGRRGCAYIMAVSTCAVIAHQVCSAAIGRINSILAAAVFTHCQNRGIHATKQGKHQECKGRQKIMGGSGRGRRQLALRNAANISECVCENQRMCSVKISECVCENQRARSAKIRGCGAAQRRVACMCTLARGLNATAPGAGPRPRPRCRWQPRCG
jgi:hypothetical protein